MEKGAPSRGMPLPAIIAIVVVVLAGTSGTVLLARDAGGTSGTPTVVPPVAKATSSPSVPPTAPAVFLTPRSSPAAIATLPRPSTGGPSPSPHVVVVPVPSYAGPTPQGLLTGPTPPPAPQESRVTPDRLTWAVDHQGRQSAQQLVVIVNIGGQPLHIFPAGIAGDQAGNFAVQSDTCSGATIQPQKECSVAIVYNAIDRQATAELRVSDDSGGSATGTPTKTSAVPLNGTYG